MGLMMLVQICWLVLGFFFCSYEKLEVVCYDEVTGGRDGMDQSKEFQI